MSQPSEKNGASILVWESLFDDRKMKRAVSFRAGWDIGLSDDEEGSTLVGHESSMVSAQSAHPIGSAVEFDVVDVHGE
jgi:hypothetical protein